MSVFLKKLFIQLMSSSRVGLGRGKYTDTGTGTGTGKGIKFRVPESAIYAQQLSDVNSARV